MDADELAHYFNLHRAFGFREISAEDVKLWTNIEALHEPPYYKGDIPTVRGILRLESGGGERRVIPEEIAPRGEYLRYESHPRKEKHLKSRELKGWKQKINSQVLSTDFQEMVSLARKTLMLPENGLPAEQVSAFLFSSSLAAWCNYYWSLEAFQKKFLALETEEARVEYLQPVLDKFAEPFARYTMPKSPPAQNTEPEALRAELVDWLLIAKLTAARLSSFLGIDNVREVFYYLLCPEQSPPESWELREIKPNHDPFHRQFGYFANALLPLPENETSNHALRKYIDASVQFARDLTKPRPTWEKARRAYRHLFPFYEIILPDTLRMRARRAIQDFPYHNILKIVRSFFRNKETGP